MIEVVKRDISTMPEMSFNFGKYNSVNDLGIICEVYDTLLPPKNERKIEIPGLSGRYDFGSETFGERTIECECKLINSISKSELREIAYILSKKNKLTFWDEPDKYYIAEIFDQTDITNIADRLWLEFTLTFICEPFAYKDTTDIKLVNGLNVIDYKGTAKTPTIISLKNNNDFDVTDVTIIATKRKE